MSPESSRKRSSHGRQLRSTVRTAFSLGGFWPPDATTSLTCQVSPQGLPVGGLFEIETRISTLRLRDAIWLHPGRPQEGHKKSGADTVPPRPWPLQDTVSPDYAKRSERNSIQ